MSERKFLIAFTGNWNILLNIMTNTTRVLALFCLFISVGAQAYAQQADGADLGAVLKALDGALTEAQQNNVKGFPPLKKVVAELSASAVKGGDNKVKFIVFSLGGGVESDRSMTLSVELKAPSTENKMEPMAFSEKDLKASLARAINAAKVAYLQALNIQAGSSSLKALIIGDTSIEVQFAVTKKAEGGIDIGDLLPVGIEFGGKISSEKTHKVKLTFGR